MGGSWFVVRSSTITITPRLARWQMRLRMNGNHGSSAVLSLKRTVARSYVQSLCDLSIGGPLLILGLAPIVSRFVVESYDCLVAEFPELKSLFTAADIELVRRSRHRSKLLLDRDKDLTDITSELRHIAESQREVFIEPHRNRHFSGFGFFLLPSRINRLFCQPYPTQACVAGNGGVRSPGDKAATSGRTAA